MFDLSGIGGFMSGVTGLNWAPNIPTPSVGDYQNLNWLYNTTFGPQGLQGLPGANASISANYSGYVGGNGSYSINNQTPVYGMTYDKVPVYAYNKHQLNPFFGPQLVMEEPKATTGDTGINTDNWDTTINDGTANATATTGATTGSTGSTGSTGTDGTTTNTDGTTTHHRHHHHRHQPPPAEKELDGTDASGNKTKYTKSWCEIMKASDANHDGVLTGDELKSLKMWNDTHHDGTVHADDLKTMADLGVAEINLQNGSVITKDLVGYRTVASQKVIGYFNANIYGGSGGSNVGFNFTPTDPSYSLQQALTGQGYYDTLAAAGQDWSSNSSLMGNQNYWNSGNDMWSNRETAHHHWRPEEPSVAVDATTETSETSAT